MSWGGGAAPLLHFNLQWLADFRTVKCPCFLLNTSEVSPDRGGLTEAHHMNFTPQHLLAFQYSFKLCFFCFIWLFIQSSVRTWLNIPKMKSITYNLKILQQQQQQELQWVDTQVFVAKIQNNSPFPRLKCHHSERKAGGGKEWTGWKKRKEWA